MKVTVFGVTMQEKVGADYQMIDWLKAVELTNCSVFIVLQGKHRLLST